MSFQSARRRIKILCHGPSAAGVEQHRKDLFHQAYCGAEAKLLLTSAFCHSILPDCMDKNILLESWKNFLIQKAVAALWNGFLHSLSGKLLLSVWNMSSWRVMVSYDTEIMSDFERWEIHSAKIIVTNTMFELTLQLSLNWKHLRKNNPSQALCIFILINYH